MDTIIIQNVGPVASHKLDVAPGVTVLTGANEAGKSTCIAAVGALVGRDEKLAIRDGQPTGLVQGCGMTLTLTPSKKVRSGALDVTSMEEKLDVSTLVNPKVQEDAARLARRIKAVLSLTGTRLDIADFAQILPDDMQDQISEADKCDDPVDMAGKIKRRMDRLALDSETVAETFNGKVVAATDRLKGQDLAVECDPAALQRALLNATQALGAIESKQQAHTDAKKQIEDARQALAAAEAGEDNLTAAEQALADSQQNQADARRDVEHAAGQVNDAQLAIQIAQQAVKDANASHTAAVTALTNIGQTVTAQAKVVEGIKQRRADLMQLRQAVQAAVPAPVTVKAIEAAQAAVNAAQAAVERGAIIRELKAVAAQKEADNAKRLAAIQRAEIFRRAAKATDRVLSEALSCETLQVIEGDLCYVEGDRRESYARLSDGKRWQIAIREVAAAFRKQHGDARLCILPTPQDAWGELDVDNRRIVWETAKAAGVAIVTAQTGTGPLRSFTWSPALDGQERATEAAQPAIAG